MDAIFVKSFFPEIFLSLSILYQLFCNSRFINNFNFPIIDFELVWQGLFILMCTLFLTINQSFDAYMTNFLFVSDLSTRVTKTLILLISLLSFILIWKSFVLQNINFFEYFSLYFFSLLGILLLVNAYDLISAYLVIELQALAFYILSCFNRTSSFSTEAGLKYFILGSFISGLFLLGSFFIYASLGTLNFSSISLLLSVPLTGEFEFLNYSIVLGVLLVIATLLFKTAVAPFHFWAPDVYEGAPLPSTIIFSLLPKLALFTFFLRWVSLFASTFIVIKILLIGVGLFSVFWGAYLAISQKRLKRFIIYSSISQIGFVVVAISSYSVESFSSVYFFLGIYLLSSLVLWGSVVFFHSLNKGVANFEGGKSAVPIFISDLSSYFRLNYVWSLTLLLIFFSFAGIPPLSGFLAKVLIVLSLILEKNTVTSILLIVLSIFSTYYYLRIIKVIFFDKKLLFSTSKNLVVLGSSLFSFECTILAFCTFLLLFIFFFPTVFILISNTLSFGYSLI